MTIVITDNERVHAAHSLLSSANHTIRDKTNAFDDLSISEIGLVAATVLLNGESDLALGMAQYAKEIANAEKYGKPRPSFLDHFSAAICELNP